MPTKILIEGDGCQQLLTLLMVPHGCEKVLDATADVLEQELFVRVLQSLPRFNSDQAHRYRFITTVVAPRV